jgi:predicted transcriptional regulator
MTLAGALALFRESGVDALPVVDALGRVLGLLTEREIAGALAHGASAAGLRADDVMDREIATVHRADEVRHVLPLMGLLAAGRLPVVDDRDRFCGMLALEDILCRVLAGGDLPPAEVVTTFCQVTRRGRRPFAAVPRARRTRLGRSA